MTTRDAIPSSWTDYLQSGPVALGLDLATTDKTTSNPSALVAMEDFGGLLNERLVMSWKTANEEVTEAILDHVFDDLANAHKRPKCLVIDATNETFYAQKLAKRFRSKCPVYLIKGSENLSWAGETMTAKQLLGNLFANEHIDGRMASPLAPWVKDDRRLVKKVKGLFNADTDALGQHGDTWDGGKLALWGLRRTGRAEAAGMIVGSMGPPKDSDAPRLRVAGKLGFIIQKIKARLNG